MTEEQVDQLIQKINFAENQIIQLRIEHDTLRQNQLAILKANRKIENWVDGADLGARLVVGTGHVAGYLIKICSAVLVIFGLYEAFHGGKIPPINIDGGH